jgi:hypothetical protein
MIWKYHFFILIAAENPATFTPVYTMKVKRI